MIVGAEVFASMAETFVAVVVLLLMLLLLLLL